MPEKFLEQILYPVLTNFLAGILLILFTYLGKTFLTKLGENKTKRLNARLQKEIDKKQKDVIAQKEENTKTDNIIPPKEKNFGITVAKEITSSKEQKSQSNALITKNKKNISSLLQTTRSILNDPATRYIIYFTLTISLLIVFEEIYDSFISVKFGWMPFLSAADKELARDFVEWFGVLYGFLLPQILLRIWKQFDRIDSAFDGEADAIRILAKDTSLLHDNFRETRTKILERLLAYSNHVRNHYAEEVKFAELTKENEEESKKDIGAMYLKEIRDIYKNIIHHSNPAKPEVSSLISELLHELNNIIVLRGARISLSSERLYESLKFLAIITSIVWLIPFYFLYYPDSSLGIFGWVLVIAVTYIVIMILTIIDDLDNPFEGLWTININSWTKLTLDIEEMLPKKKQHTQKKRSEDK